MRRLTGLATAFFAAALTFSGCAHSGAAHHAKADEECAGECDCDHDKAKADKAPAADAKAEMATCPVSGEEFALTADTPKSEHDGKTYYFCCNGCKPKFDADPASFVK